ncbi:HTH_Tnp_Tc3_2 domain-containing protein [Trichonephila clavipes]|nr:HTH_Tnp_Tc3_2 domain-containing protein [Trichonephila clavipes]
MLYRGIRFHYEHLSEFERRRIIELKEAGWANRRITRHMGRSDAAIRRCWQEWVENDRFQRHDGSGRPRQQLGLIFQQDTARPHTIRVTMNCLTACQALPWSARSLSDLACLGYDGKATASNRECS